MGLPSQARYNDTVLLLSKDEVTDEGRGDGEHVDPGNIDWDSGNDRWSHGL